MNFDRDGLKEMLLDGHTNPGFPGGPILKLDRRNRSVSVTGVMMGAAVEAETVVDGEEYPVDPRSVKVARMIGLPITLLIAIVPLLVFTISWAVGSMATTLVKISVPDRLAAELPTDPALRSEVLDLGLRSLRIREALEAYRRGEGSLAHAAEQAGVALREMIPLAYAHGLTPKVDAATLEAPLSIEQAAEL